MTERAVITQSETSIKNDRRLQKVTLSESRINDVLKLNRITFDSIKHLTDGEIEILSAILTEKWTNLKGEAKDDYWEKIEGIAAEETRNELWERNHDNIMWAITDLINHFGRMPGKAEIAKKTGLSRKTIHKHFKEYAAHPLFIEQLEHFRFMGFKVLSKVFQYAIEGNVKAAKLYQEVVGQPNALQGNGTFINNQNNYIQINGIILSQEEIRKLNPEQLTQIESIVKMALPEKMECEKNQMTKS